MVLFVGADMLGSKQNLYERQVPRVGKSTFDALSCLMGQFLKMYSRYTEYRTE